MKKIWLMQITVYLEIKNVCYVLVQLMIANIVKIVHTVYNAIHYFWILKIHNVLLVVLLIPNVI